MFSLYNVFFLILKPASARCIEVMTGDLLSLFATNW